MNFFPRQCRCVLDIGFVDSYSQVYWGDFQITAKRSLWKGFEELYRTTMSSDKVSIALGSNS